MRSKESRGFIYQAHVLFGLYSLFGLSCLSGLSKLVTL